LHCLFVELCCQVEIFIFIKTYVGSESEIDVFESVDKQRRDQEMVWLKYACLHGLTALVHQLNKTSNSAGNMEEFVIGSRDGCFGTSTTFAFTPCNR
jgi:hypothetical protein